MLFRSNPNIDSDKKVTVLPPENTPAEPDLKSDLVDAYEQSKDNLQELIDNGKEAMEELLAIAKEGQHPRAYEVVSTIIKTLVDANKDLVELSNKKKQIELEETGGSNKVINNTLFVGTTSDLQKLLKDMKNEQK